MREFLPWRERESVCMCGLHFMREKSEERGWRRSEEKLFREVLGFCQGVEGRALAELTTFLALEDLHVKTVTGINDRGLVCDVGITVAADLQFAVMIAVTPRRRLRE